MNRKTACFCLLLVLMATWVDRLATGTFFVAPLKGTPSFGEEIYTLAMRNRDKARETIEAPPLTELNQLPLSISLAGPDGIRLEKAIARVVSSVPACYLLMSLQR